MSQRTRDICVDADRLAEEYLITECIWDPADDETGDGENLHPGAAGHLQLGVRGFEATRAFRPVRAAGKMQAGYQPVSPGRQSGKSFPAGQLRRRLRIRRPAEHGGLSGIRPLLRKQRLPLDEPLQLRQGSQASSALRQTKPKAGRKTTDGRL
jgi:hypothetical protein